MALIQAGNTSSPPECGLARVNPAPARIIREAGRSRFLQGGCSFWLGPSRIARITVDCWIAPESTERRHVEALCAALNGTLVLAPRLRQTLPHDVRPPSPEPAP